MFKYIHKMCYFLSGKRVYAYLYFGESSLQAASPRLLLRRLGRASATGGQERGEARIVCSLSQHLGESLAAAASLLWLQLPLNGLCCQGRSFTGGSSSVPPSTRSGNTVSAGAPAAPGVGASRGSTSCSCRALNCIACVAFRRFYHLYTQFTEPNF